jgi:hypothetical protein
MPARQVAKAGRVAERARARDHGGAGEHVAGYRPLGLGERCVQVMPVDGAGS